LRPARSCRKRCGSTRATGGEGSKRNLFRAALVNAIVRDHVPRSRRRRRAFELRLLRARPGEQVARARFAGIWRTSGASGDRDVVRVRCNNDGSQDAAGAGRPFRDRTSEYTGSARGHHRRSVSDEGLPPDAGHNVAQNSLVRKEVSERSVGAGGLNRTRIGVLPFEAVPRARCDVGGIPSRHCNR